MNMAVSDGAEELAILLQETVEELKQQRELNQQLKVLMEQNSKQLADATARGNQAECNSRPRRSATQVAVSLETRVSGLNNT